MDFLSGWESVFGMLFGASIGLIASIFFIGLLLVTIPMLILQYKMVSQTNKNSWSVFIPFYGDWVVSQIAFGDRLGWISIVAYAISFIPYIGGLISSIIWIYTRYKFAEAFGLSHNKCIVFAFVGHILALYFLIKNEYVYIGHKEGLIHKYL